jgi:antitoxin component YwqK of YwqJK toxin-antitoxin module
VGSVQTEKTDGYWSAASRCLFAGWQWMLIADSTPSVEEEFYSNGQLKTKTNHQSKNDGRDKHGLFESFHENGQLSVRGNWKDGNREGLFEWFDEDGYLILIMTFKNGELVEKNP